MKYFFSVILLLSSVFLSAYYYGQNKVQPVKEEWSVIQSMHFDIYYPKGMDEFGKNAVLMAEDAYYYLKDDFKSPLVIRFPIIFYETHAQFQTTNVIYPLLSEGVGGFTESLQNRVVIPFDGSYKKLEEVLTHELTHAYINALDSGYASNRFFNVGNFSFPFWFAEGMPEYEAIGGTDVYNNMFVLDMIMNDYLESLDNVDGYYAYREGESFLAFLRKKYGKQKVMEFFYSIRATNNLDKTTEKIFGMKFKELGLRWKNELKRDYYPYISNYQIPYEGSERITDHKADGSYFNEMPRISPNGQFVLYFSNRDLRFNIWRKNLTGEKTKKKLITGEATGKFEEFHYQRNNIAWFPDSLRFAFVSKTVNGDKIYIVRSDNGKILDTIQVPGISVIYEIDISPDGKTIAISGQKGFQTDLYVFDIQSREVKSLTSDQYDDKQPRFSPDGSKIAFVSERSLKNEYYRKGLFSGLVSEIYYIDLNNSQFYQVTDDSLDANAPMWDSSGTQIIYVSQDNGISNFFAIDINSGQKAPVTQILSGTLTGDLDKNNETLVYASFFDNGWDLYTKQNPLLNLSWKSYHMPIPVTLDNDFLTRFHMDRYAYFGKRERKFQKEFFQPSHPNSYVMNFGNAVYNDSTAKSNNLKIDIMPDSILVPKIMDYKLKFFVDQLWGGAAYSTSAGTIGQLILSMSDLMGNNAMSIQLGVTGKLRDTNFVITYLYLPYRIDYGIGIFKYRDETIYEIDAVSYLRNPIDQIGVYFLTRYPINKFLRFDFEHYLYQHQSSWDYGEVDEIGDVTWHNIPSFLEKDLIYAPAVSAVWDNTQYGPTGPVLGWRGFYQVQKSLSEKDNDFITNYTDLRAYQLFAKRYALAGRLIAGISTGNNPENFDLNGFTGVRGYDIEKEGSKKFLTSAEMRFPLIDYLNMAFPVPIVLNQIRGSMFVDMGSVWDDNKDFRGIVNGRLRDLVMGFGFGPRMNLGYFVLKWDVAWKTDFITNSKPVYYFSLGEDF